MNSRLINYPFFILLFIPLSGYCSDFPGPPKANLYQVTESTTSLGLKLQIRKFETDMEIDSVLNFYRNIWKDKYAESKMPPWNMIGIREGDEYWNVQIQEASGRGSWGYLSKSDLPELLDKKTFKMPSGKNFPMMSGSVVLDDQVSKDPGRTGRVLLIKNNFTPKTNHNYYRNYFVRKMSFLNH